MKGTRGLIIATATFALSGSWTLAQEDEGDGIVDQTMDVMPQDADGAEAVTEDLAFPTDEDGPIPADQGATNGGEGLLIANQARDDGEAFGAAAAAATEDNREQLGRASVPNLDELIPQELPANPDVDTEPPTIPAP